MKQKYNDAGYNHLDNRSAYMAPELWEKTEYGLVADSWTVGAVLYHLITGYLPFKQRNRKDRAYNALIENNSEEFWNSTARRTRGLKASTKSLLFNLLKYNPEERLDIENVKNQTYYKSRLPSDDEYFSVMKTMFKQFKWRD